MLSCDDATSLIARAVDAVLDQEDLDRLRAHLWQCGPCRMEVESHLSVKRVLAERRAEPPPAGFRERLRLRLDREARHAGGHQRLNWRTWSIRLLPADRFESLTSRIRARFRLRSQMPPPPRE